MKKWLLRSLVIILSFSNLPSMASLQDHLHRQISPLLEHHLPRASVGIAVADAKTGHIIYEYNGFHAFNPASCAKLFSTSASLYALGPEFRFSTDVFYNKTELSEGVLQGNLYIKFSGDPSLTVSKLKNLITELHQSGVQTINGNLILDNTAFIAPWYGPGWSQDDLNWYFAAPITSIILNQNAITGTITPNSTLNQPATLRITDKTVEPFVTINSQIKTVTYQQSMQDCEVVLDIDQNNRVNVSGCWPSSEQPEKFNLAIRNPDELAKQVLTQLLKDQHIELKGQIHFGPVPKQMSVVLRSESQPLKTLIFTLLKESNNVYAEAITKTLGRQLYQEGSFLAGSRAIKSILKQKTDIDFDHTILVDGSGLSRYDLVTPRQILRLLHVMGNHSQFSEIFINALPESGTDGTLTHRMKSPDLAHRIHAKTGTFQGTSTLSGYLTTRSGKKLIFSVLINQVVGNLHEAKSLQSKIASILYSSY